MQLPPSGGDQRNSGTGCYRVTDRRWPSVVPTSDRPLATTLSNSPGIYAIYIRQQLKPHTLERAITEYGVAKSELT